MTTNLFKIGGFRNPDSISPSGEIQHFYLDTFETERTTGPARLRIGASGNPIATVAALSNLLSSPFFILLVLHTTRCGNRLARYQSPPLERIELDDFLAQFADFLSRDARHDFWLHSPNDDSTIVLDRHNLILASGHLDEFRRTLEERALHEGPVKFPVPHSHHYHQEFDEWERQIVKHFEWKLTPLRPDDEQ